MGDALSQSLFNPIEHNNWKLDKLIIGNYVCIASGAIILMGGNNNHNSELISVYPFEETIQDTYQPKGDTHIGSDVWIVMNAMILPGIKIGDGAIIAAGSVVTRDIEPYTIVGGNPAKTIRMRYDKHQVELLQTLRWFDWPRDKIIEALPLINNQSVEMLNQFY